MEKLILKKVKEYRLSGIVNMWPYTKDIFIHLNIFLKNWQFKIKKIIMYFRGYNVHSGKMYDNQNTDVGSE